MTVKSFIKSRPYLVWYVKDTARLSQSAVLEAVLNYGDFSDVKTLLKVIGTKKAAGIFRRQMKSRRHNYRPEIANYFKLYFQKHA